LEVFMEATNNDKADIWRKRIDDQRVSGQSVRAWCGANDAREHSFYWWRRRLCLPRSGLGLSPKQQRPIRPTQAKPAPLAFTQVVLNAAAEPLRLRLAGERELILPASMPLEQVAKLIHCIEGGGEACRVTT
jgi:hypothetical protein